MFKLILDMVYPPRCPICHEIVVPKEELICRPCRKQLTYIKEPRCKCCGKPVTTMEKEYCHDCQTYPREYIRGYSLWLYEKPIKQSINQFKYGAKREYANFYIQEFMKHYGVELRQLQLDCIIPIPLHQNKLRERGFNQAEVLAKGIGSSLDVEVRNLLLRQINTKPQKGLNDRERIKNLENAFKAQGIDIKLKKVLLVDDIYTTGATINACAKVLKNVGVEQVYFSSLCIGSGM